MSPTVARRDPRQPRKHPVEHMLWNPKGSVYATTEPRKTNDHDCWLADEQATHWVIIDLQLCRDILEGKKTRVGCGHTAPSIVSMREPAMAHRLERFCSIYSGLADCPSTPRPPESG